MTAACTRRSFTESLAFAALAPALGFRAGAPIASHTPGLGAAVGESVEPGALARALGLAIRAQYGARLSRPDLVTITQQIQSGLDRAAQVRKVQLANGDEPYFVFSALSPATDRSQ